jgi:hypothetical protein
MARKAGVRRIQNLPKFEDWTPPWKDDEFDAEKAKKLIYDLHADKETLFKELDTKEAEIEDLEDEADALEAKVNGASKTGDEPKDGETEIAALRREIAALREGTTEKPKTRREIREAKAAEQGKGGDSDLTAEKYRIALDKGLSSADARRLVGDTVEELEADADKFLEDHGGAGKAGSNPQGGGKGGQAPPSNRPKPKPRTGTAADEADEEITDPGKLYDEVLGK